MNGTDVNESVTDINESVRRIRAAYADIDKAQSNAMEAASIAADGHAPAWVKKVETEERISERAGSIADRLKGEPAEALAKAIKTARRISKSVGPDLPELSGPSGASGLMRTTNATLKGTYDALADLTGLSGEKGWNSDAISADGIEKIREKVDAAIPVSMETADREALRGAYVGVELYISVSVRKLYSAFIDVWDFFSIVWEAKKKDSEGVPEREKNFAEDLQAQATAKKASPATKPHMGKGVNQTASKPQPKPSAKPLTQSPTRVHDRFSTPGFRKLANIGESFEDGDQSNEPEP